MSRNFEHERLALDAAEWQSIAENLARALSRYDKRDPAIARFRAKRRRDRLPDIKWPPDGTK